MGYSSYKISRSSCGWCL